MTEKLKHCPFCGSVNISRSIGAHGDATPWPYVECEDCGANTEPEVWNKRSATPADRVAIIEECARIADREARPSHQGTSNLRVTQVARAIRALKSQ